MRTKKGGPHRQIAQMRLDPTQFNWTKAQQTGQNATPRLKISHNRIPEKWHVAFI